ncbi:hypothetical protein ABW19_dt0204687 [Dactylella cylindrospora]|nr:hypothetical protein ABW19_dt0204687 [Dactylella cylindrospora]
MSLKLFLVFVTFVVSSQALPELSLNKRGCNSDNCLRNLRDTRYSSSASEFCSLWLQTTITNIKSVTATVPATATSIPEAITEEKTVAITVTETDTVYTTEYPTAVNTFAKRGDDIGYPSWLTATYPPSRVSSACSCFITSPSAPATECTTTTVATLTETSTTILEPLTYTETETSTAIAHATATEVVTGPSVPCGAVGCNNANGFIDQTGTGSIADCKAYCLSNSCQSYQYSEADGICNIFELAVADSYATGFFSDCPSYKFYDPRCLV